MNSPVYDPTYRETILKQLEIAPTEQVDAILELAETYLEEQRKANPLKFYEPNGAIEEVIKAVANPKKFIYVMPAANSVGKSAGAIAILGSIIWPGQNKYFCGERFDNWKYPKKFWYISEHSTLKDFICGVDETTESEIRKWFPRDRFTFQKSGLEYYSRLTSDTGWSGSFKSYDQDVKQFESDKIGIAVFDEPPPETIFNAVLARLTLGGIIIMPMTPLTHSAWVQDRLIEHATEDSNIFVLFADIETNCRTHGVRGRLEHEQIERLISQYDQDEVEARAHGKFTHLRGIVYKGIHPAKHRHTRLPSDFNQRENKIYCVLDPHDRKPPMIAWFAVDQWGNAWCIDEFPDIAHYPPFHLIKDFKLTTEQVCQQIIEKERMNGWDGSKIKRIIDPNFGRKPIQAVGKTVQEYIAFLGRTKLKYQLNFDANVNDNIEAGHKVVKDYLSVNPDGDTRFRIGENCHNIWHHMTHYTYKDFTGKRAETDGIGERVAEKFKDGSDVVRYFFAYLRKPTMEQEQQAPPASYDELMDREIDRQIKKLTTRRTNW